MEAPVYRGLLLTEYFLVDGILDSAPWKAPEGEDYAAFSAALPALVGTRAEKARLNEANTKAQVIIPLLDLLGWKGAQHYEGRSQSGVLDILLMRDAGEWGDDASARAAAVTFLEAKKWGLPLDRREGTSEAPSTQMLRYLTNAAASPGDGMRWGILTNGRHWRLYWQGARSRSEEFFELDLRRIARGECENPEHWRRVFYLMFSRPAFLPIPELDRRTFHAHAVNEGRLWEARITEELSAELLDESLPELARAVAREMSGKRTDPDFFERLRDAVTTILFRLLFVLYAEDRGLLPMGRREYKVASLSQMRDEIANHADRGIQFSEVMGNHFVAFSELCGAIGQGDEALGLPPYNGKLFADNGLSGFQISNLVFARLVDKLSRRILSGKKRRINYRDLSVRHLGAVYERLLLHEFADHPQGGVQVRLSPYVRKNAGSYYTPDELTELVIERTLSPLLSDNKRAWDDAVRRGDSEAETKKLDPAAAALNLRICDPAMGSGHFLAAVVDHIADKALEYMAEADEKSRPSPVTAEIANVRARIVQNAKKRGIELPEHLDDRLLVRRLALKRAVYGVDKNPWAAELAKLSLWLHTFTVGAPLSFLNHHLQAGDSLFGEWIESGFRQMEKWGGALFTREFLDSAREAAALMAAVEARPDADVAEVRGSARDYRKFAETNRKLENLLRLIHSLRWMAAEESGLPRKERERRGNDRLAALVHLFGNGWGGPTKVLEDWALPKSKRGPSADIMRETLVRAAGLNRRERFLHWESVFPGVWPRQNGGADNGGFDAVVGNPPWDRMRMEEIEWFKERRREVAQAPTASERKRLVRNLQEIDPHLTALYHQAASNVKAAERVARTGGEYPMMSGGDLNLYSLFVERAMRLIRPSGMIGLLTPSGIFADQTSSKFFREMSTAKRLSAVFDFHNRRVATKEERAKAKRQTNGERPRTRFFSEVDSRVKFCAFVAGGGGRKFAKAEGAFSLNSVAEIKDEDRRVEMEPDSFALVNPNTDTAPIFRTRRDQKMTLGVYRKIPVLHKHGNPRVWAVAHHTMFHMKAASGLFRTSEKLEQDGCFRVAGNIYKRGKERVLPLYVGRMIGHFNHRANSVEVSPEGVRYPHISRETIEAELRNPDFAPEPEYWVDEREMEKRLPDGLREGGGLDWFLGFRSITNPTNERCIVAALIPRAACGNNLPLLLPETPPRPKASEGERALDKWQRQCAAALEKYRANAPLYAANLCSFALDYICRQKMQGTNMNFYIMEQLPVIPVSAYSRKFGTKTAADIVREHVLRLTYVSEDMRPFARDQGFDANPRQWDETERTHLRARLDALYFILYGFARKDVDYVLSTFPIALRNERERHGREMTRELIPQYMSALKAGDWGAQIHLRPTRRRKS